MQQNAQREMKKSKNASFEALGFRVEGLGLGFSAKEYGLGFRVSLGFRV